MRMMLKIRHHRALQNCSQVPGCSRGLSWQNGCDNYPHKTCPMRWVDGVSDKLRGMNLLLADELPDCIITLAQLLRF